MPAVANKDFTIRIFNVRRLGEKRKERIIDRENIVNHNFNICCLQENQIKERLKINIRVRLS